MIKIPSDTTLLDAQAIGDALTINLKFYTEETKKITFAEVLHFEFHYGWNSDENIEALIVKQPDNKLIEFLEKQEENTNVEVFEFINSLENYPLVRVIARHATLK